MNKCSSSTKANIAIALDQFSLDEAINFVRETKNDFGLYKVGMELFYLGGKDFIQMLSDENVKIFLDLKLHDIPTTVAKSIKSLSSLEVEYLTIHLTGGPSMLKSAMEARNESMPKTKLLGVSYLTSLNDDELKCVYGLGNQEAKERAFQNLFSLASEHQIQGVVHSGEELELASHHSFISVCPGIRFLDEINNATIQDQKRVFDPASALKFQTATKEIILVIGRSLTKCSVKERSTRIDYLKNLFNFNELN